ncbi:polysaccharide export outer membrane protein [Sphingomonas vulcanisoli]|uniref:Polysaccharide export outer membrane protein n=1 Tax=Sphingomonas vulcanisoli TaxID=1658060 RepID=A0ABX0TQJ5_9SPHN|nr:polysaccharide biosynthesis/export family protein [Sphingomonas vulcanisoli]NIJ07798.1 polysaccharide export outer membrane protein [Sphingomonas vulcanisoli]
MKTMKLSLSSACLWAGLAASAAIAAPPAAPTAVQSAASAPASGTSTYRISPGDGLEVYVWGDERLQRTLTVLPDGSFSFPLAGTVMAAGHTSNEVETQLSKLLAGQYKGVPPQVTVSVRAPSGMQISVIGKVHSPGTFSPTRYLTVLDALALSGGPTDFADVGGIVVLRNVNGRLTTLKAKLGGILKGKVGDGDLADIPMLQAGDTVIVP